ncbi:MAG: c-type cytochrome [Nitrospirota bacterium]|nr:c-type cytochrome [Nitrospirota bacterium]
MTFDVKRYRRFISMGALVLVALAAAPPVSLAARSEESVLDEVQRGGYLVAVMGCHDCHTPQRAGPDGPVPDLSRMLSGHPQDLPLKAPTMPQKGQWQTFISATNTAFYGPWGVSFAANLTGHMETGIGTWSLDDFKRTMTTGRHLGTGRPLLPPMIWSNLARLTDQDLAAIFAYLKSIPRVDNQVPEQLPLMPAP